MALPYTSLGRRAKFNILIVGVARVFHFLMMPLVKLVVDRHTDHVDIIRRCVWPESMSKRHLGVFCEAPGLKVLLLLYQATESVNERKSPIINVMYQENVR